MVAIDRDFVAQGECTMEENDRGAQEEQVRDCCQPATQHLRKLPHFAYEGQANYKGITSLFSSFSSTGLER